MLRHFPLFAAFAAFAIGNNLAGEEIPAFIGKQPVPTSAPFTAKAGRIDTTLPFTASWYADYLTRWPRDKPSTDPALVQAALGKLTIPLRIFFPSTYDEHRHYPLFIANFTEFKDSRDQAGAYVAAGNGAGYVVAGFALPEELKVATWGDEKLRAGVCIYVASTITRWASIDPNRIYVGGHSGGSKISTGYLSCYPADFAGVMVLGCNQLVTFDSDRSMPAILQGRGVALFSGTGEKDPIAGPASSKAVFEQLKTFKFPYTLYADHDGAHAVVDGQNKTAFAFFSTSYADWYAKTAAASLREGLAAAKAKRYGDALFPLMRIASFAPDSDTGKKAQAELDAIELARTDGIKAADKLVEQGKKADAKRALNDLARRFQGSWYQFELVENAKAIGK